MNKSVKVAIIDNSVFPEIYRPVEHWRPFLTCEWEAFSARSHRFPRWKDGFTHLILTGSEASILEMDAWAVEEAEVVRDAVEKGFSVLGSCWGHQLLAYVLAGPEHVRRCAEPEIGWMEIRVKPPGGPLGNPGKAYTFSLHFDEVFDPGPEFDILAETDICRVQAFRSRDRRILGIQAHPEINPRQGHRLLTDMIRKGFPGAELMKAALRREPRDSDLAARILLGFLGVREDVCDR